MGTDVDVGADVGFEVEGVDDGIDDGRLVGSTVGIDEGMFDGGDVVGSGVGVLALYEGVNDEGFEVGNRDGINDGDIVGSLVGEISTVTARVVMVTLNNASAPGTVAATNFISFVKVPFAMAKFKAFVKFAATK